MPKLTLGTITGVYKMQILGGMLVMCSTVVFLYLYFSGVVGSNSISG